MKFLIDTQLATVQVEETGETRTLPLYSDAAFEMLSRHWLAVGWNQRYSYTFSWLGRPIIQLPEDMVRTQEVLYRVRPDVVLETGVAHGGSLIYYASLCKLMGTGRVIGVDIEIRPHNRAAIEAHEMAPLITLIEGGSTEAATISAVGALIHPTDKVLILLDSNHSRQHVLDELEAYHPFVSPGSYIVATDGIMRDLADAPRGDPGWKHDNPAAAAREFLARHPEFELEQPPWPFNESSLRRNITHWPDAWLKKR